jgi:hypothetical protein
MLNGSQPHLAQADDASGTGAAEITSRRNSDYSGDSQVLKPTFEHHEPAAMHNASRALPFVGIRLPFTLPIDPPPQTPNPSSQ